MIKLITKRLTTECEEDRAAFNREYGWSNGCCCHINPPCSYCTHPGNPSCLEDDSCYVHRKPTKQQQEVFDKLDENLKNGQKWTEFRSPLRRVAKRLANRGYLEYSALTNCFSLYGKIQGKPYNSRYYQQG
jgi:hypothetical protein